MTVAKQKIVSRYSFWFTCIFQVRKFSNMLIVRSAHMSVKSPAKVIVHSKEIYVISLHDPRTANEFVPILLYKTPCHQKIARQVTVSSYILWKQILWASTKAYDAIGCIFLYL